MRCYYSDGAIPQLEGKLETSEIVAKEIEVSPRTVERDGSPRRRKRSFERR